MGTILLYPTTMKQTHHMLSSKRIFMLRSKVWGSCSRLEFKAGVDQDSRETWGRHQAMRNTRTHQQLLVYTEKDLDSAVFQATGIFAGNTGLPYTDIFLASPSLAHFSPSPINFPPHRTSYSLKTQSQFTYTQALCF